METAPAKSFYAILGFRHKRDLLFWLNSQKSFCLWALHCQPTNGAVNITFVEGRKSSPSSSQHWCPCNLQVSKVVVNVLAALAVLLSWAVLHWCAFIFLHFECKQKSKQSVFSSLQPVALLWSLCLLFVWSASLAAHSGQWVVLPPSFLRLHSLCRAESAVMHCWCFQVCLTRTVCHALM